PAPHLPAADRVRLVLRRPVAGDGRGRAQLQQQPGLAAGVAAGRRRQCQPDGGAPAAERPAGVRGRGRAGAGRVAVAGARARARAPWAPAPRAAARARRACRRAVARRWRRPGGAGLAHPPARLAGAGTAAHFHHPPARARARLGLGLAGGAAAGLPGTGGAGATPAGRRRRRQQRAPRPGRRRRAPPARLPPRRPAPGDRVEAVRAPRHAAGARVRTAARCRRGARLERPARAALRGAHPQAGALGGRRRTRRPPLPPATAGAAPDRAWLRGAAPPRLPARAGADAVPRRSDRMKRARKRGPEAGASPMLDAQSRAWALLAAGACLLPLLLQLPPMLALAIGAAALAVGALSWRRPVPGWARLLLALLLVALVLSQSRGFGRDTACALLAAMLAIKPAETQRLRDGRSLVGFALFAPFATFLLDQGPLPLLLALLGATLALAALLRMAELESGDTRHAPRPMRRLARVWRLVAIGLPLALAAFWLFPRLASPLWGVPERAMARPGLSDTMSPGDWLEVLNDDTTALRVQFHGATPAREEMYWRGPVLWHYDGRTWTRPDWLRGVPPAPV